MIPYIKALDDWSDIRIPQVWQCVSLVQRLEIWSDISSVKSILELIINNKSHLWQNLIPVGIKAQQEAETIMTWEALTGLTALSLTKLFNTES